jgi:hypothetical protein
MTPAYIHVLDHDFHAVSAADGSFQLPRLKPGEYKVMLWHEGWKSATSAPVSLRVAVKLGEGEGAAIEWTLPEK